MSAGGEVLCSGWLRKSPPERKLRRYAWKKRWFVLRSGRMSGNPNLLEYYKNEASKKPIRVIDLNFCEQVDSGLQFERKEFENSFIFDLRTCDRTFYLVADTEMEMNKWVRCICDVCGFNPTDPDESLKVQPPMGATTAGLSPSQPRSGCLLVQGSTSSPPASRPVSGITDNVVAPVPAPMGTTDAGQGDYLWLTEFVTAKESARTIGAAMANDESDEEKESKGKEEEDYELLELCESFQLETEAVTGQHGAADLNDNLPSHKPPSGPCPRSQIWQRRPWDEPLGAGATVSMYGQHAPPRPPKSAFLPGGCEGRGRRAASDSDGVGVGRSGGSAVLPAPRSNTVSIMERSARGPRRGQIRACAVSSIEAINGSASLSRLASPGYESSPDSEENYVSMGTNSPLVPRAGGGNSPSPPASYPVDTLLDNYMPMSPGPSELPSSGCRVPPPPSRSLASPSSLSLRSAISGTTNHGLRVPSSSQLGRTSNCPPSQSQLPNTSQQNLQRPPVNRQLKPDRKGKPPPMDLNAHTAPDSPMFVPVTSPISRTFSRPDFDRSQSTAQRPLSTHSSNSSSDSQDSEENYVPMRANQPEDEVSRIHFDGICAHHRVEYLDLDLQRSPSPNPARKKSSMGSGIPSSGRVDYVEVDPERTRALQNTRQAWTDGRQPS
uniref:GRB2-associated-binding protein 1-like isoform X2 n=1 Tax=Myxine glutinosa TaxID=7769 RepID=UPI0035900AC2